GGDTLSRPQTECVEHVGRPGHLGEQPAMGQGYSDIPRVGAAQHGDRPGVPDIFSGRAEKIVEIPGRHQLVIRVRLDRDDVLYRADFGDRPRRLQGHQCTAAYMIVSSSALWPSNSSTIRP